MGKSCAPRHSWFASEAACLLADMLASWNFLSLLQGRSFEGKACAVIGKDCMVGGLVMAMLGARVAFLIEAKDAPHVQQNINLFRESLDYTQMKSSQIIVAR